MTWTTRQRSEFGDLSAIVAGSTGPDIVLLHGVGLPAEAWNAQIDALADKWRVTAIDLPGHGASPRIRGPQTLANYASAIRSALPEHALVIGHSFGAMIALELASRHPEHIAGVAALNAIRGRTADAKRAVQGRAARLNDNTNGDPEPTLRRWFGTDETPARTACRDWLNRVDPIGYKTAYTVFANADGPTDTQLKTITCPALFMTGGDEPNSTPAMSEHMAAAAPRGRARVVERAAHMMPMTHPDIVTTALVDLANEVFE